MVWALGPPGLIWALVTSRSSFRAGQQAAAEASWVSMWTLEAKGQHCCTGPSSRAEAGLELRGAGEGRGRQWGPDRSMLVTQRL